MSRTTIVLLAALAAHACGGRVDADRPATLTTSDTPAPVYSRYVRATCTWAADCGNSPGTEEECMRIIAPKAEGYDPDCLDSLAAYVEELTLNCDTPYVAPWVTECSKVATP